MPQRQFDLKIRVTAKDDGAGGVLGGITSNLQKLGTIAVAGIGAVGAGVAYIASQAIPAASDLNESLNATSVVFGDAADIIQDFGKTTAEAIGLSEQEFNQLAATTGAMLKNYGLGADEAANATVDLGKRAADMASIFNTDVDQAMTAINAALRGEADPIERFGVSMNAASVEAKALALGYEKVNGKFETAALTQARLALLFEQTNDIAGDFANTSDQLANATRINEARWKDFMAKLGQVGLPIMTTVQKVLMDVGDKIFPMVEGAISSVLPYVESFSERIGIVVDYFLHLIDVFTANEGSLTSLFLVFEDGSSYLSGLLEAFGMGEEKAQKFGNAIAEFLKPIAEWLEKNVSLNDVLIGLGVAIGSVVIPLVVSLISTLAPIIAIFAAVVLAVSLLRQAWENDFWGIRTILENVWNNGVKPAFEYMKTELLPRVIEIFGRLGEIWQTRILPLLDRLGIKIEGSAGPAIQDVLITLIGQAVIAIEHIVDIVEFFLPLLDKWIDGIEILAGWFISARNTIWAFGDALGNLRLPDWLTPGSPTPLEMGLRGINDEMDKMSSQQLPSLSRGLDMGGAPQLAGAAAGAGGFGNQVLQLEIPLTIDGREVGYASIEGTLDALDQRGKKFRKTTG